MPGKHKVTLYLSDELHRQFKIRSAVDGETMSSMAQRAIEFYLKHADVVEGASEGYGRTHQVHSCPQCDASVVMKDNDLTLLSVSAASSGERAASLERLAGLSGGSVRSDDSRSPDEGELITC